MRHVAAHLLDTALRTLSFGRDGATPPPPDGVIGNERDLAAFINDLNASWIQATERLSPNVLTHLYDHASRELANYVERLPLEGWARFGVSWAGETRSETWFHVHASSPKSGITVRRYETPSMPDRSRIRDGFRCARGRGAGSASRLPWIAAAPGRTIQLDVTGPSGGRWLLVRRETGWDLQAGAVPNPTATVTMSGETAWRLLFNALSPEEAEPMVHLSGDIALGRPILNARSVVI